MGILPVITGYNILAGIVFGFTVGFGWAIGAWTWAVITSAVRRTPS
jgi:hypothetical protein